MNIRQLSHLYAAAHDSMRNIDGLQPQEAFDELLKYLFFKETNEECGPTLSTSFALSGPLANGASSKVAGQIRSLFKSYVRDSNGPAAIMWREPRFRLSDAALARVHELISPVPLSALGFDVRGSALKTFLPPEVRKGLGIFLTPDDVARMMVEILAPELNWRVFDPACGSGTFLIEVLKYWSRQFPEKTFEIFGSDFNPRMLLLAELNLGHQKQVMFHRWQSDALKPELVVTVTEQFDAISTNPPFGVVVDESHYDLSKFATCRGSNGSVRQKQQSEVIFIEQCLHLLKPGGKLAIVLPKSVISNATLAHARETIDKIAFLDGVIALPAETFSIAGTQTTTAVLFLTKRGTESLRKSGDHIRYVKVKNVGYDATGRARTGNELPRVPEAFRLGDGYDPSLDVRSLPANNDASGLAGLATALNSNIGAPGRKLSDLCAIISTGRTPPRAAYTAQGLFILKVGNLTGRGLNWSPRERNFVSRQEAAHRHENPRLSTADVGDIIFGFAANSLHADNRLIYAARVSQRLINGDYFKKSEYRNRADCIYSYREANYRVRSTARYHGSIRDLHHDLGTPPNYTRANVLLSKDFCYFGAAGSAAYKHQFPAVTDSIRRLKRGHRVSHSTRFLEELERLARTFCSVRGAHITGPASEQPSRGVCLRGSGCGIAAAKTEKCGRV